MNKKKSLLLGLLIGICLKLFVIDITYISGSSMKPTLTPGSFIIHSKLSYGLIKPFSSVFFIQWSSPKKNDIVLYPMNNHFVIKRCVAVAGETLEFSTDSGYSLSVGEKTIPLSEAQYQRIKHSLVVPVGMILAVGDNYQESVDSRDYGFVSVKNILGKALCK